MASTSKSLCVSSLNSINKYLHSGSSTKSATSFRIPKLAAMSKERTYGLNICRSEKNSNRSKSFGSYSGVSGTGGGAGCICATDFFLLRGGICKQLTPKISMGVRKMMLRRREEQAITSKEVQFRSVITTGIGAVTLGLIFIFLDFHSATRHGLGHGRDAGRDPEASNTLSALELVADHHSLGHGREVARDPEPSFTLFNTGSFRRHHGLGHGRDVAHDPLLSIVLSALEIWNNPHGLGHGRDVARDPGLCFALLS
nr:hypothetical protein Iba_chr03aCG21900 [Ipomoea batatas]